LFQEVNFQADIFPDIIFALFYSLLLYSQIETEASSAGEQQFDFAHCIACQGYSYFVRSTSKFD